MNEPFERQGGCTGQNHIKFSDNDPVLDPIYFSAPGSPARTFNINRTLLAAGSLDRCSIVLDVPQFLEGVSVVGPTIIEQAYRIAEPDLTRFEW